ncbi:DUF943 family protein [Erwinia sp. PK3-005]|uniref:DUF943 family protein n=1 Tax=Mixta hanseatica TaxID=2872648 RepID=A0ABY4RFK2_9GAMM|nr:DUF943 family protein [Mixta hanseatica]UQY45701.1 DUF943 family protein [Mixta hanseatica]
MIKNKKLCWTILIITAIAVSYFLWLSLRPVKIVAVHDDGNYSDVLVNQFPITVRGKIGWWRENREMLKSHYGIPKPSLSGSYTITFWLFGDGYMEEEKYDRLCFLEMKTKKNCIEKEKTFTVRYSKHSGLYFLAHDGYYQITDSGKIVKRPSH